MPKRWPQLHAVGCVSKGVNSTSGCKLTKPYSRAAIAAIMKLQVYIKLFHATPTTDIEALWYESLIWAVCEHGLSLFAATIIAVRPFFTFLTKTLTSLSSSLYGSSSKTTTSRRTSNRFSATSNVFAPGSTELRTVGVRKDFEVRNEYNVASDSRKNVYAVDAYHESSMMLVRDVKGKIEPGSAI